jgi:hypothetical protein
MVGAIVAGVQHDRLQDFLLGIGAPQSEVDSVQRILAEDSGSSGRSPRMCHPPNSGR